MARGTISSGTITVVAVTNAVSTVLAANASRKGLKITNPLANTGTVYLSFGTTNPATTSMYLAPGDYYEDTRQTPYTGAIKALLSVAGPENISIEEQT